MVKTHGSIVLRVFALFAVLSGVIITLTDAMSSQVNAEESVVASVAVEPACSFGVENTEHTDTIAPGNNREGIGGDTIFTIYCNDMDGYVVYAVGYSNDEEGTTAMIGSDTAVGNNIATGTATTGSTSNWSYKVQLTSSDTDGIVLPASNSAFTAIPNTRTAVMQRETGRPSGGDKFNVSYAVYVSDTQVPGTYTGKVRYTLFQPHSQGPYPLSMQKVAEWIDTVNPGDTITVMDERDGNTYRVRLLADGQLWMIDNLRLGDSKLSNRTLTSGNTDLNGDLTTYILPESSKDSFKNQINDVQGVYVVEENSGNEKEIYGGYYTFNAATAGTGASATSDDVDASSSICPKGWRLPRGNTVDFHDGEFDGLNQALGGITDSDTHLINPDGPAFLRAGYYDWGVGYGQGSTGFYWSSTSASSSRNAYYLYFNSSTVDPNFSTNRYYGISVRCVARE